MKIVFQVLKVTKKPVKPGKILFYLVLLGFEATRDSFQVL